MMSCKQYLFPFGVKIAMLNKGCIHESTCNNLSARYRWRCLSFGLQRMAGKAGRNRQYAAGLPFAHPAIFAFLEYTYPGSESLTDLSKIPEGMAFYLDFLKQSKGAARSVNANVNALNNFSIFLGLDDVQLKRERIYYKPAQVLSAEEQDKFLRAVERQKSARDRALALVLFYTGLRIGECACLSVENILPNNSIETGTIDDTYNDALINIKLSDDVDLSLNKQTQLAMRQWLVERAKIIARRTKSEHTALWLTRSGRRLSISGIAFVIKRIGWQVQVIVSAEILRRTWLSNTANR